MRGKEYENMRYLPVGLDVRNRSCVVVGGGKIGTRKARNLIRAGARVMVVSPEGTEEITRMAGSGVITWLRREYLKEDVEQAFLVVAATDNAPLNTRLIQDGRSAGALTCNASSSADSELIFGALHHGDDVTVAVFTDGRNPSLARQTRDRIAALEEQWEGR